MKRRLVRVATGCALSAIVAVCSACGQSGPLYLPKRHAAPAPATAAATTALPAASTR